MSKMSRDKGARGEREFFKALYDLTGIKVERNLLQSRYGGADADRLIAGYLAEIKRCERLSLNTWWQQACRQAEHANAKPLLAYRQNHAPWRIVVPMAGLIHGFEGQHASELNYAITLPLRAFAAIVQERLAAHELEAA